MATARRIPEGHEAVTAYLTVKDAAKAIDFYVRVFGATELMRLADASGRIGHAELKIGNGILMLADEHPEFGRKGPAPGAGAGPVGMHLYVNDVDMVFKKALAAGGSEVRPPKNEFYGDRAATFMDPFGHRWMISTHVEDVTQTEIKHRYDEMVGAQKSSSGGKSS